MYSRYPFIAPCPADQCRKNNERFQWVHADCGKKMYINLYAELECENGHRGNMIDWLFQCDKHDYEKCSKQGLLLSLTIIATTEKLDNNALKTMTQNLINQS